MGRYAWTVEIAIKSCFVTDNEQQKVLALALWRELWAALLACLFACM